MYKTKKYCIHINVYQTHGYDPAKSQVIQFLEEQNQVIVLSVVFFVFVIYLNLFVLLEPGNCLVVWLINDDHYHLIVYSFISAVSLDLFQGVSE